MIRFHLLTLFPGLFDSCFKESILGRAIAAGHLAIRAVNIRDFAAGKHKVTDDTPYGGGQGMVMKPEPIFRAVQAVKADYPAALSILLTPRGEVFNHRIAQELTLQSDLILICGRYEGVDERVRELCVDREISLGDYVLCGGEPAAWVMAEAVCRLVPGVLGDERSAHEDSFSGHLLEYPQYTRPPEFEGRAVPETLLSGDHARIAAWRRREAIRRTWRHRPDLLALANLTPEEREWLEQIKKEKD